MLGSTAYACNTWKHSTCCCLCQTETFPLMYQFYHKYFPVQFRAEHQHDCWALHSGKRQLLDCQGKQLLALFCNSRKKWVELLAFKIQCLSPERTTCAFWWSTRPSFCDSVVYSEAGKGPEDRNTASQVFLPIWLFCPSYCPTIRGLFWERETENKFGEVVISWQLQFIPHATSNIHT